MKFFAVFALFVVFVAADQKVWEEVKGMLGNNVCTADGKINQAAANAFAQIQTKLNGTFKSISKSDVNNKCADVRKNSVELIKKHFKCMENMAEQFGDAQSNFCKAIPRN